MRETEFNRTDEESFDRGRVQPRDYEITMFDPALRETVVRKVSGMLGINDVFVAVVDPENRLVFASPIEYVYMCQAIPETVTSKSVN